MLHKEATWPRRRKGFFVARIERPTIDASHTFSLYISSRVHNPLIMMRTLLHPLDAAIQYTHICRSA